MFGFVYRKMGQAGKMTSTVLTFCPSSVRVMLHAIYNHTYAVTRYFCRKPRKNTFGQEGDEWSPPFMNTSTSDVLNLPALSFEIVNSIAPNAWRTASATQSA